MTVYYRDDDGDGYGVDGLTVETCGAPPSGYAAFAGDCDDADASMSPANDEDWLDGIDDNCDGVLETEMPVEVPEATVDSWDAPTPGTPELRVLAVYESGDAKRQITVTHDIPEAVVLALGSYRAVDWIVEETYPGTVQQVVLIGNDAGSTVSTPEKVPVQSYVVPMPSGMGFGFETAEGQKMIAQAVDATGLELTSFHGVERASWLTIAPGARLDGRVRVSGLLHEAGECGGRTARHHGARSRRVRRRPVEPPCLSDHQRDDDHGLRSRVG